MWLEWCGFNGLVGGMAWCTPRMDAVLDSAAAMSAGDIVLRSDADKPLMRAWPAIAWR